MTEKLNVLQYNVRKSGNRVMAPLLADPRVSQFSLLAIHEPFHNSFNNSTHNPSYTSFHLFHPGVKKSCVCFFINKSVFPCSWSGDFPSPDYGYLQLKSPVQGARDIMIHNIYRPQGTSSFLSSYSHDSDLSDFSSAAPDNSDVFSLLHHALLDISVDHVLLGDFNFHHSLWGGAQATADPMAENFISFFNAHFLHLLLPQGSITRSENGHETTINLVFASPPLKNSLESCRVRKDLHQGSDHLPILSVFSFLPQLCQFEPRPLWKKADEEAIKERAKEIGTFPRNFSCIPDIDFSVNFLISWMKEVIDQHVPLSKPAPFRVPWWSQEIGELVEDARRAFRRHRRNPNELARQEYLEANKAKGAAIRQAKRKCFEEAIENVCKEGGKSFWRLAKWAKSISFLPPTPPSIPSLTTPQGPATTLEAKCDALKARFFPPIPPADLSDIP